MRTSSARPTGRPAASRSSTMSKPLYLGDLAQPGAQHRLAAKLARQQQVAGIDRHAEMDDLAAGFLDAGGYDVVTIDDRRGAGDQEDIATLAFQILQGGRDLAGVMRDAALADQCAAERRQPPGRRCHGLGQNLVARAGQPRLHKAGAHRLERRDRDQWLVGRLRDLDRARDGAARRGIGNDLDRGHHLARLDPGIGRQGRDRDRFVELVQRVDALVIDNGQARFERVVIAAAGEGRGDLDALAGQRLRHRSRGLVLVHVVGIETGGDHARHAGRLQPGDIGLRQHTALGEVDAVGAPTVRQDGAGGLVDGRVAESHGGDLGRDHLFPPAGADSTIWPGSRRRSRPATWRRY